MKNQIKKSYLFYSLKNKKKNNTVTHKRHICKIVTLQEKEKKEILVANEYCLQLKQNKSVYEKNKIKLTMLLAATHMYGYDIVS